MSDDGWFAFLYLTSVAQKTGEPVTEVHLDGARHRLTRPENHEAAKLRAELERYRSLLLFKTNPRTARVIRELIAQIGARLQELRRAVSEAKP